MTSFRTRTALDTAIDAWIANQTSATSTYGDINTWDVSAITDFSQLFKDKNTFNSDIRNWDVSNGTDFSKMFYGATAFNKDIGSWDVSNGNDFSSMFENTSNFSQDVSPWNTNKSTNFAEMFYQSEMSNNSWPSTPTKSNFLGQTKTGSVTAETITGGAGNDVLSGFDGNDTFYGGDGSDTYIGGSGDDFAVFNFNRPESSYISSTSVTNVRNLMNIDEWDQKESLSDIEGKAFLEVNHGGSFVAGQASYHDIDGGGSIDIVFQVRNLTYTNRSTQSYTHNNYGSFEYAIGSHDGVSGVINHNSSGDFHINQMQFADINGDGATDAIWQGFDNQFWINYGGYGGLRGISSLVDTHGGDFNPDKVQYVDVTGDGAQDLIYHGDDNRFWLSKSNGTNFDNPIHVATHGGPTNFDAVQYADVDGDGKKDMIYHGIDNRFWIGISDGSSFGNIYYSNTHGGDFVTSKVQYADFDGDGKDDMIYQGDDNRFWVSKSDGTKFVNTEGTPIASHTYDDFDTDQVNFFDMNGDNKADMVYQGDGNEVWYYESNGSNFNEANQIADFAGSFIGPSLGFGDINGDGSGDLIFQDSSNDFYIALNSDFM